MDHNAVVIDNGTGFTKMGYAGNEAPEYIIPTCILKRSEGKAQAKYKSMEDLDFYIGHEAIEKKDKDSNYEVNYPMKHGVIENWSNMELYWEQCFFNYLRCDPEENYVLLTEPPLNPPENREALAEIMFETFNVKGIYIAVQAVLALSAASYKVKQAVSTTGTVIDSGDGVTHVIPVVDGFVLGSAIKHVPLAGRDITKFIGDFIKQRETVPQAQLYLAAQKIKEKFCYICSGIGKEFGRFDAKPSEFIKPWYGEYHGKKWQIDVGYEQFLGPELFFNPEIFSSDFTVPLPQVVDDVIQQCPIDCRRQLYANVCLSGGSTMFPKFGKRLEKEIAKICDNRLGKGHSLKVNVHSHNMQRYAVWFGGAVMAQLDSFPKMCHTREAYEEYGPSIARQSAIFGNHL